MAVITFFNNKNEKKRIKTGFIVGFVKEKKEIADFVKVMKSRDSKYAEIWIASNSCFDDFKIQCIERIKDEIIIEVCDEVDVLKEHVVDVTRRCRGGF